MVYIPGLGGSSYPGGVSQSAGLRLIGFSTLGATADGFDVALSVPLTPNKSVLVIADLELATAVSPDFALIPTGGTAASYSYRFVGASAGTGTVPRVARIAASGAIGMRLQLSGLLTLNESGRLHYNGQFSNSTVGGALAAGSNLAVFQLF